MTRAFDPVTIGSWELPQSFVMAPLTRNRAGEGHVPTELNATYYGQRAGAGLIVSEGTAPSRVGQGYLNTPGLYSEAQVRGWRLVADAVHRHDGRIVAQLMHAGRVSHPDNKEGAETIAPSAVRAPGQMITADGPQEHALPRSPETAELAEVVEEFASAARNAVAAGLDGVEVHAANGYLLHQFLDPTVNLRDDVYGGTPEHRARFVVEVVRAVADAIGPEKVGLRISPAHHANGIGEEVGADLTATYRALVDGVADLRLAYLSVLAFDLDELRELVADLRERFDGPVLLNSGFAETTTLEQVEDLLATGLAEAVVVGRPFLANPDLARRWQQGAALNEPDQATFYGGGAEGYTDYPTLEAS